MNIFFHKATKILVFGAFLFGVSFFCNLVAEKSNEHYFLPEEHPITATLNHIFSSSRVLGSLKAMKAAGFISPKQRLKGVVIGVHPKLKGYLLKVYLDTFQIDAYAQWVKRIEGALLIRRAIDRYGLRDILRVPKKWIYILPAEPSAAQKEDITPHHSILVVEDMNIVKRSENAVLYKNAITEKHLDALFKVLIECKLTDSVLIDNIPFTKHKKIAFVDTEISGRGLRIWLRLQKLKKNFSPEMQRYWNKLIRKSH